MVGSLPCNFLDGKILLLLERVEYDPCFADVSEENQVVRNKHIHTIFGAFLRDSHGGYRGYGGAHIVNRSDTSMTDNAC